MNFVPRRFDLLDAAGLVGPSALGPGGLFGRCRGQNSESGREPSNSAARNIAERSVWFIRCDAPSEQVARATHVQVTVRGRPMRFSGAGGGISSLRWWPALALALVGAGFY
jgi:hypothetical protein